jgi:hypothetical protein
MQIVTKATAAAILADHRANGNGTMFTVTFIKKDESVKTLNGRFGVKKHLKGGELGYNPAKKGLMGCFEVNNGDKNGYKMINLNTIQTMKVNGIEYNVIG